MIAGDVVDTEVVEEQYLGVAVVRGSGLLSTRAGGGE